MAMKIQDTQDVTISVPNGDQTANVTVTHNLQDAAVPANILDPDMIVAEIVNFTKDVAAAPLYGVISKITRTPGAATFVVSGYLDAANDKATAVKLTVRVTSLYWHTIQGDDHTP